MDQILSKAGSQIITFAVRSGVSLASGYVIKSVSKAMETVPEKDKKWIEKLRDKLQTRIEIVTYAIELIQLVAARGNTGLESTIRLVEDLKYEIDEFNESVNESFGDGNSKVDAFAGKQLREYMQTLLTRIDQTIPIINLALTTSGASLSTGLSNRVSPGRLLQASNIVVESNKLYNDSVAQLGNRSNEDLKVQVGPVFNLTMYDIFHNPAKGTNDITWREKFARCDVKIIRKVDSKYEYKYKLLITENFNDGRYHDSNEEKEINIEYDLSSFQRLFFSGSGRLLKLNDRSSPVLVLKINKNYGTVITKREENTDNAYAWIALGDYEGPDGDDDDDDDDDNDDGDDDYDDDNDNDVDEEKTYADSKDDLSESEESELSHEDKIEIINKSKEEAPRRSLSILEYLIRLCVLQSNDQISVLEVNDERLNIYLSDENNERSSRDSAGNDNESSRVSDKSIASEEEIGKITKGIDKLKVNSDK